MKLTFYGAARVVTGSCYLLEHNGKKIIVDCGMFQGRESKLNYDSIKFDARAIDAVLLTHAHLDHCGLLPKLVKQGYRGPIYCTPATADLAKVVLEDSAHLQQFENKWDNKRLKRQGKPLRKPLYKPRDAKRTFRLFKSVPYNQVFAFLPEFSAVFRDAGHILGSAHIELFCEEKKIVFSGDIGQYDAPIIDDPSCLQEADYVICESTYGDRIHEKKQQREKLLYKAVNDTAKRKGKLLIPSFAIERTQELIYTLNQCVEKKCIPLIPIYIDSPMATKATRVFIHHTENYDEDARDFLAQGKNPFQFPNLIFTEHTEESKALNTMEGPAVIIAGSGMCTGGRIKHHIINHMPKNNTIMLFVGFQAYGSLGRRIQDGQKNVRIYGQPTRMNGEIRTIEGFSAHADRPQLMKWLSCFKTKPKVFFTHGELKGSEGIKKRLGRGYIPKMYETVEL